MFFTRFVSLVAAIVVFITTYALVLPAITLEKTASCGIDEHQHDDSCYEYVLTCGLEESEGHHHDDSCYTVTEELECQMEEHQHSQENGCYDEEGNLICQLAEHAHDDSCYSEKKTLTCDQQESEGHQHTDACYEKVLVCDKEVHVHSAKCYKDEGNAEESNEEAADQSSSVSASEDSAGETETEAASGETLPDTHVPELDPLNMEAALSKNTGFYYFHAEEGQEVPDNSTEITDWQEVKEDTELAPTDSVKMYLPYTIPAGSLNETNPTARYRLPENIHLTDDQIKAINKNENGITAGYAESDPEYQKYLGAEAIEGNRTLDEILQDDAQEYISAVVKAENVYDVDGLYGEKGAYLGQDLIFTFVPYSIEKNQITYDAEQNPVSAGEKITGWFACDFRLDQIDWIEKDKQEEIQEEALEETQEETDQSADDTAVISVEKTAEILFVSEDKEEDIEEIKRTLKLVEKKEDTEDTVSDDDELEEETPEFQSGTLTADGDGYKIILDYTEEAKIPENASLSVREITAETDKEAYEACLAQAQQHVDESGEAKSTVDSKASRFFDIEIQVSDEDGATRKIEPAAPVSVNIQIADAPAASADTADSEHGSGEAQYSDPTVLHFAEEGVEKIESSSEPVPTESGSGDSSNASQAAEVRFEAESFSIYGVVYTVDFHWEVDGKKYDFSIPGGGFVSLGHIVEVLGISNPDTETEKAEVNETGTEENTGKEKDSDGNAAYEDAIKLNDAEVSETTRNFLADVEKVEFSDPQLMWVGKAEDEITVGGLKEANKLKVEYSADLTEDQIAEINAQTVEAGDWALISMLPFTSDESLTVTMKNGDQFVVKVTDAQISTHVITADGKDYNITVTYDDTAQIPEGAELKVAEITDTDKRFDKYLQRALKEAEGSDTAKTSDNGEGPDDMEPADETVSDTESAATAGLKDTVNTWSTKPATGTSDQTYARFFDIEIKADGRKVEPKADVSVQISLRNVPGTAQEDLKVVHFGDAGDELMTADASADTKDNTAELSFVTDGFSVYAIASRGDGTDVNIFNKEYVLVHNNVALSPEPNPSNTNHLRGISVSISGDLISTSENSLPVWKIERYWDNNANGWRYNLSTMMDGSKVYLNLQNQSGGSATVSSTPQALLLDTQNNDHYECRFRVAESPNAALDLDYNNINNGFHAYVNGSNVYFRLYELGEEIRNKVTVHFVDRYGNPINGVTYSGTYGDYVTRNADGTFSIPYNWKSSTQAIVDLKNDFVHSGYTYASSHLAGARPDEDPLTYGGLTIDEKLHSTGNSLEYYTDRGYNDNGAVTIYTQYPYQNVINTGNTGYFPPVTYDFNNELKVWKSNVGGNDVTYSPAGVDKDVYVILDPSISNSGSGGSGSGSGSGSSSGDSGDSLDVDKPDFQKKLDKNPDGTYTLSLSVTGHSKNIEERPKANILFVVDTSSSMTGSTSGGSNRLNDTKEELVLLGGQLLDKNTPGEEDPSVEVTMISFDGNVTNEITNNNNEPIWIDDKDTFTGTVRSSTHLVPTNGTDWEDGLKRALVLANAKKEEEPDQPVFIVFFTDGEPSQYTNFQGQGSDGYYHYYNYYLSRETSKDELRAIVQAGHRLYGVYAFNQYGSNAAQHPTTPYNNEKGHDLLHHAIQYGYNTTADLEGSYYHYASNRTELNNAFTSILRAINEIVGFNDLVLNDSITSLTSVGATNAGDNTYGFKYTRSGGRYRNGETWTDAPPVEFTEADGDNLAKVSWDLSTVGYLEDGVTYTVSFTVWPQQEAYDYVTKLNNGFITIDQIPEEARSCFLYNESTGKYEVRTNPVSGPDGQGHVVNEIDYKKENSYTVNEDDVPEDASQDPAKPDVTTSQEGDWPQTRTETWYEYNEEDETWIKHVTTQVITAFGPPDKNMELDDNAFRIQKKWEVNRREEMIQFLYDVTTGLPIEAHKYIRFNVQEVDNPDNPINFSRVDMGYDEQLGDYKWADDTVPYPVHDIVHQVGTIWEKDLDISYGLMISPSYAAEHDLYLDDPRYIPIYANDADRLSGTVSYYVLEKGHDYKIDEPALDYRFDFKTEVYHPMLVDGVSSNVKIAYHGNDYGILEKSGDESILKGTNVLRGELKLRKIVLDMDGARDTDNDAVFDFKVTLTNNNDPGPFYDDPDNNDEHNIPWYGVKLNGEGEYLYYHKTEPNPDGSYEYTDELHACVGGNYINGLLEGYEGNRMTPITSDGTPVDEDTPANYVTADIKIKATDEWIISNIPSGTTYKIEEDSKEGYEFANAEEIGNSGNVVMSPSDPEITGSVPVNKVTEVDFTNKIIPTALEVHKVWTDGNVVDHGGQTIEYKIYRIPVRGIKYPVEEVVKTGEEEGTGKVYISTMNGYTGVLNSTKSWRERVTGLPRVGQYTPADSEEEITVLYEYYVTEETPITGYTSAIDGGEITEEGEHQGEFSYTITNKPMSSADQQTRIDVQKEWKNFDGSDVDLNTHKNDSIVFEVTQKKYEAKVTYKEEGNDVTKKLYPITINLVDKNGDNSVRTYHTTVVYVPEGASFTMDPIYDYQENRDEHMVTVTGMEPASANYDTHDYNSGPISGTNTYYYPDAEFKIDRVDSAKEVTLWLHAGRDVWDNLYVDTDPNTNLVNNRSTAQDDRHKWTCKMSSDKHIIWDMDTMIDKVLTGTADTTAQDPISPNPVETNTPQYTMTLTENETGLPTIITRGENAPGFGDGDDNEIWKGSVTNLPLYEYQGTDNKSYIYTYEVTEAAIGSNEVNTTNPPTGWNGQTSSYFVKWNQDTQTGLWTIINQLKDELSITLHKVDKSNINADSFIPLKGAAFKLVRYTLEGNEDDKHWTKDTTWGTEGQSDTFNETADGVFNLGNLKLGYYEIVESQLPTGYVQLTENSKFQVRINPETNKREAVLVYNADDESGHKIGQPIEGNATDFVKIGIEDESATIIYGNTPGAALPNTGGPGTRLFTILGSILILGAGVLLWRRRRTI